MGFHELFERENVLDILQKTLSDYYGQAYPDRDISIGYKKTKGAAEFIMIPRIGAIMQTHPCSQIRKHFYDSYNIRNSLIKHIAAKLLVFASMHAGKLVCSKQRLYIAPGKLPNRQTIYAYCNRSVRLFDYGQGTTVSIQKHGFTDKFFQNQLQFRLKHPYPFIPPILRHGQTWFEEEIYEGKMLARISDKDAYEQATHKVLSDIQILGTDTQENTDARQYISHLTQRLETMLQETAQKKATTCHPFAAEYLQTLKTYLQTAPATLPTVISHKDLQGGNILVTPEKLWIIDWETQGRGSRWFDAITLLYGTRYYGGIRRLTQDAQADALPEAIGMPDGWSAKQILAIFLLEDLEFYLEDMLELPGTAGSATFDRYMTELREIDWSKTF